MHKIFSRIHSGILTHCNKNGMNIFFFFSLFPPYLQASSLGGSRRRGRHQLPLAPAAVPVPVPVLPEVVVRDLLQVPGAGGGSRARLLAEYTIGPADGTSIPPTFPLLILYNNTHLYSKKRDLAKHPSRVGVL